jgi:hypothetical protein
MFYRAGELQVLYFLHCHATLRLFPTIPSQVAFVQRVIDLLASRPDKMDQDAVLTALTNWNGPPLPLYIFPPHLVQNGWQVMKPLASEPNLKSHFFFSSSFAGYTLPLMFPPTFRLISSPDSSCRWALLRVTCPSLFTTTGPTATRALTCRKCASQLVTKNHPYNVTAPRVTHAAATASKRRACGRSRLPPTSSPPPPRTAPPRCFRSPSPRAHTSRTSCTALQVLF